MVTHIYPYLNSNSVTGIFLFSFFVPFCVSCLLLLFAVVIFMLYVVCACVCLFVYVVCGCVCFRNNHSTILENQVHQILIGVCQKLIDERSFLVFI